MKISLLPQTLAICRLENTQAAIPEWALQSPFFSVTRTEDELSVVCAEEQVPEGTVCDRGWRALKLVGPFDLSEVGILSSLAVPLAEARLSIFVLSTYDTDYLLVRAVQLEQALSVLTEHGHTLLA